MRYFAVMILFIVTANAMFAQNDIALTVIDAKGYPTVRVPFRITEDGSLQMQPNVDNIRFVENGTELPFTITCPERELNSASIAIGLERSLDNNFNTAKQAVLDFLTRIQFTDNNDNASYWSFSTIISREVDVVRDSLRLYNEISNTSVASFPFNGTPLYETMHRAIEDIVEFGTEKNRTIVFFTDGVNNTSNSNKTRDDVIRRANVDKVRVYVVAVGNKTDGQTEMRTICQNTGGLYFHVSETNAYNEIYQDIIRESVKDYWCTLEFRSPLCPNGSARTLAVEYTSEQGETFGETVGYTAPFVSSRLSDLHLWASPASVQVQAGDTIEIAFGSNVQESVSVGDIALLIEHQGLLVISQPIPKGSYSNWSITNMGVSSFTTVDIDPPGIFAIDTGITTWFRMHFVAEQTGTVPIVPRLISEETECLRILITTIPHEMHAQLDTVLGMRNEQLFVPFRVMHPLPKEGIQRIDAEISFDLRTLSPTSIQGDFIRLHKPEWYLTSQSFTSNGPAARLQLSLQGPAVDSSDTIFSIALRISENAGYFNPVTFTSLSLNDFGLYASSIHNPGMVVVRDSCRNNLTLIQSGLAVTPPVPSPASERATFFLSAPELRTVYITVYDALGKQREEQYTIDVQKRTPFVLPLDMLEDGIYIVKFETDNERVIHRVLVTR